MWTIITAELITANKIYTKLNIECKTVNNLGIEGYHISNYEVYMDDNKLVYKNYWNVDGSLSSKAGYYGINSKNENIADEVTKNEEYEEVSEIIKSNYSDKVKLIQLL